MRRPNIGGGGIFLPHHLTPAPVAWYRYGQGLVITGSGVSQWDDAMGEVGLILPGVAGNYASTPDSPAVSITGDIDVRVRVAMADWTPAANSYLVSKAGTVGQYAYDFYVATTGNLVLRNFPDGLSPTAATSTAVVVAANGATKWVRATRNVTTGDVMFYTSDDGASWVQLGATVSTAAGGQHDGTDALAVGAQPTGNAPVGGSIYHAQIYNGINGTLAAEFYPARDSVSGATSFASSTTGETWTVNSTAITTPATIGRGHALLQGVDASRPLLQADKSILTDGIAQFMKANPFTLNNPVTIYLLLKQVTWTNSDYICDGNTSARNALRQINASPIFAAQLGGANAASNASLAVDTYGVVSAVFGPAGAVTLQVNMEAPTTGTFPASTNSDGFTLGANATPNSYSNLQVMEGILYQADHAAIARERVIRYLASLGRIAL